MTWNRGRGRWSGAVVWTAVTVPALALVAAAVLDRGPGGAVRLSLFPAALAALDDHVWECAWNSLAVAVAVTIAARVVGVGLARVVVRWRFWGRTPLVALACAGAVVPPAFGALGLRCWFGPLEAWPHPWAGHLAWFWVALTAGAPLVGLASASALARVDPLWEDAARLAGAGRIRVWRQFVWPVVRPDVGRSLALVFTLTLLEPGAPLVLGLRRSLGYQIAEAALGPGTGEFTRAAVLTLAGVLAAGLGRLLIGWWGGARTATATPARADAPPMRSEPAAAVRGAFFAAAVAAAAAVAWLPTLGVAWASLGRGAGAFAAAARDPLSGRYLVHSAVLGLGVVAFDLVLARAIAAWSVDRRGRPLPLGRLAHWPEMFPPIAVGVAVLSVPWALRLGADVVRASGGRPTVVEGLSILVDALDPDRTPWVALIVAVGLARLPLLKRSAVERRLGLRPSRLDAAVSLGATRRQSRRTLTGRLLGASPAVAFLTFALASTSVTPALVLAPTADTRPVGPAVLALIDEPDRGLERAAALATLSVALNLAALAVAARGRKTEV